MIVSIRDVKCLSRLFTNRRVGQRRFCLPHFLSVSLEEGGVRNDDRLVCGFRRLKVMYDLCLLSFAFTSTVTSVSLTMPLTKF